MFPNMLKQIFNEFEHEGEFSSYTELASGHINDTYLIETNSKTNYVLQRINHGVFRNIPGLIQNKVLVSHHIRTKLKGLKVPKCELERRVLSFFKTRKGEFFFKDTHGNYWNMMLYIDPGG